MSGAKLSTSNGWNRARNVVGTLNGEKSVVRNRIPSHLISEAFKHEFTTAAITNFTASLKISVSPMHHKMRRLSTFDSLILLKWKGSC